MPASPSRAPARTATRRSALGLAAALLLPLPLAACASDGLSRASPVEISVVDRDSGGETPLLLYRQDGRTYVAGRPSARYAIRLRNQTAGRVLVVLAVDGVNVVSGQTAAYGQTGYVLDPWRSADINGWRKSDSEIAAFEFAALADSYAARTGRPGNVGVIGMAVFLEKPLPPPAPPVALAAPSFAQGGSPVAEAAGSVAKRAAANGLAADRTDSADQRLGTAHGQREFSYVQRTAFEKLSHTPQQVVEIAYDSHANLVAAGIIPGAQRQAQARAFPLSPERRAYVPDPPPR